ncbi:hypothetical protein INT47_000338 [Mucor saturninus]|uniref:Uncharacterized protein n=1 Tax=Mucor saturninus TaxID=64648 RepID=A0A8H7V1K4_9FUNG|nr:hypothetical protein INT47_000338 [Mucor saturninus]
MNDDKDNTKTNASDSGKAKCKDLAKEYFFIKQHQGESSAVRIVEHDKLYVPEKEEESIDSIIKTKACTLRKDYHHLDFNAKAIISLDLNSILDLSYKYPDAQSTLFNNRQWLHLQRTNKPKKYVSEEYANISTQHDLAFLITGMKRFF